MTTLKTSFAALSAALFFTACNSEPMSSAPPASAKPKSVSIESAADAPPPAAPTVAAEGTTEPTPSGEQEPAGAVTIEALNTALKQYVEISPTLPDDLGDLYRAKLIPVIPVPPPGMQYVVDKRKGMVTLVSQ